MSEPSNIVTWELDGDPVDINLYSFTATEWRDARTATGLGSTALLTAALTLFELDAVAALLWLVLRRSEPDLTYETVASKLTIASLGSLTSPEATE